MSWAVGTASANALGWVQGVCRQEASVAVAGMRVEVREAARSWGACHLSKVANLPGHRQERGLQTALCSPGGEVAQREACTIAQSSLPHGNLRPLVPQWSPSDIPGSGAVLGLPALLLLPPARPHHPEDSGQWLSPQGTGCPGVRAGTGFSWMQWAL